MRNLAFLAALPVMAALASCSSSSSDTDTSAKAYVVNGFDPTIVPVGIFKVSYRGTVFTGPLADGQQGTPQTISPGAEQAYALAAFGWTTGQPTPKSLTLVRTKDPVESAAGASVPIVFSLPSHQGKCASPPLSADDYAKAAKTYFPTDTVDDYASIQCGGPPPADAGPDGSTEAGTDASADVGADASDASDSATDATTDAAAGG